MIRAFLLAVLYVALSSGANPAWADGAGRDALLSLRTGDMRKLAIHETPRAVPATNLKDMAGNPHALSEMQGHYTLVNFWATWCAPCRKEMPALNALQKDLGSKDFQVVLVAAGRNPPSAIKAFFSDAGIDALDTWLDPKMALAGSMGVFGLPVTVILSPDGKEIARATGEADWHAPDALTLLKAMLGQDGN